MSRAGMVFGAALRLRSASMVAAVTVSRREF
jgi:hypothetical protein